MGNLYGQIPYGRHMTLLLGIFLFVALCSLYAPKIINFGKCIHLLQAKMHSGLV